LASSTKRRLAARSSSGRIVFGLVAASAAEDLVAKTERLLVHVGKRAGLDIELDAAATYESLAKSVAKAKVDVAWLPPIVYVRLASDTVVLGSVLRGEKNATYEAALVVNRASKIRAVEALRGLRAGWVDKWSAAGFVLPRVNLALLGIDPRTFFRSETFFGTHRAVIQALVDGRCDVAGTYSQPNRKNGAWTEVEGADVRVLATFGAIPPDVIAARATLHEDQKKQVWDALVATSEDATGRRLLRDVLGGDALKPGLAKSYDSLGKALDMATKRGLFD